MSKPKPRTVRRYTHSEFEGIRGDDELVSMDPDCKVLKRDGELVIVSDKEVTVTL